MDARLPRAAGHERRGLAWRASPGATPALLPPVSFLGADRTYERVRKIGPEVTLNTLTPGPLSRAAARMTHTSPSSRYNTSSHSVMDTTHRSSHTPGGHARRSVLRHGQHASATVPGVRNARGAGCQPACSHPRRRRQVLAVADGALAGRLTHRRARHPPRRRTTRRSALPCRGYPAAARPAPQGLPRRAAGFEPAASPARTPTPSPAQAREGRRETCARVSRYGKRYVVPYVLSAPEPFPWCQLAPRFAAVKRATKDAGDRRSCVWDAWCSVTVISRCRIHREETFITRSRLDLMPGSPAKTGHFTTKAQQTRERLMESSAYPASRRRGSAGESRFIISAAPSREESTVLSSWFVVLGSSNVPQFDKGNEPTDGSFAVDPNLVQFLRILNIVHESRQQ